MVIWVRLFDELRGLFILLSQKEVALTKKLKYFIGLLLLLFIVLPISVNFLAMVELKQYASILESSSSISINQEEDAIKSEYITLEYYISNNTLPINNFKIKIANLISNLTTNLTRTVSEKKASIATIKISDYEINNWFTFIGFDYKHDVYIKIFIWNIIPLSILSIIFSLLLSYNNIFTMLIGCVCSIAIFAIYSAIIGYIFSRLCCVIFYSAELTQNAICIMSLTLLVFWLYKLVKLA